jgi:serine/threonine protein kinase
MPELSLNTIIDGLAGRYRVLERRGEGGFGVTFRAEREGDGHPVLLKALRLDRMRDWKALELFEREARALSQLSHPGIPRYYDFFAYDGERPRPPAALSEARDPGALSLILVQDFIAGRSLEELVASGRRFTAGEAAALLSSLLDVLAYLHSLLPPVIHRDINPRNVILNEAGAPFLVDFGAIQERIRAGEAPGSTSVGSFGYMPLEQAMGRAAPASDLYALAMTALYALTHTPPNEVPVDAATGKVELARLAPNLPENLRSALDAMLEPISGRRVQSAEAAKALLSGGPRREVKVAMSGGVSAPGAAAREPLPPGPRRYLFTAALAAGVLVVVPMFTVFFNDLSETKLVQLSPLWFLPLAFGISGHFADKYASPHPIRTALLGTILAGLGLVFFFGAIFPSL